MGSWAQCRNCGNQERGEKVYECDKCGKVYCWTCAGPGMFNPSCPRSSCSGSGTKLGTLTGPDDDDDDSAEYVREGPIHAFLSCLALGLILGVVAAVALWIGGAVLGIIVVGFMGHEEYRAAFDTIMPWLPQVGGVLAFIGFMWGEYGHNWGV